MVEMQSDEAAAYHEAGHLVVAHAFGYAVGRGVTIDITVASCWEQGSHFQNAVPACQTQRCPFPRGHECALFQNFKPGAAGPGSGPLARAVVDIPSISQAVALGSPDLALIRFRMLSAGPLAEAQHCGMFYPYGATRDATHAAGCYSAMAAAWPASQLTQATLPNRCRPPSHSHEQFTGLLMQELRSEAIETAEPAIRTLLDDVATFLVDAHVWNKVDKVARSLLVNRTLWFNDAVELLESPGSEKLIWPGPVEN